MKKMQLKCALVAFLIVFTLVIHFKLPYNTFKVIYEHPEYQNGGFGMSIYLMMTSLLFVILNPIAAFGLFKLKTWGFKVAYLAIISTTFTGFCYLPLTYQSFYRFFLSQPSIIPTIIINFILLAYVAHLNIQYTKLLK